MWRQDTRCIKGSKPHTKIIEMLWSICTNRLFCFSDDSWRQQPSNGSGALNGPTYSLVSSSNTTTVDADWLLNQLRSHPYSVQTYIFWRLVCQTPAAQATCKTTTIGQVTIEAYTVVDSGIPNQHFLLYYRHLTMASAKRVSQKKLSTWGRKIFQGTSWGTN